MEKLIKKISLFLFISLAVYSLWADGGKIVNRGKGKTILVTEPNFINITSNSFIIVQTQFSSLLKKYTSFTVIDEKTKDLRKTEIKKSAGAAYDDDTMLEAGRNLASQYLCIPSLEKNAKFYTISARILDVETGEILSVQSCQSAESVLAKNIDKLFYSIFSEDLKFDFVKIEKNQLLHESEEETSAEELQRIADGIAQDIEKKKVLLENALKENAGNFAGDEMDAMRISIDAEISRLQAEQENYARRANQKREDEEKARRAEEEARKYSEEQKLRAKKLQDQLEFLQNKMKAEKKEETLPDDVIHLIETQKKALDKIIMDNLSSLIVQKEIDAQEFAKKEEEIRHNYDDRSKYLSFYDEDGELNMKGRKAIKDNLAYEKKIFDKMANINSSTILGKTAQAEKDLRSSIASEEKGLAGRTYIANSLLDDSNITMRVGEYNGSKDSWPLKLTFDFGGVEIWNGTCYLSYQDVTGEKPVQFKPDEEGRLEYQKFQEKIIVYDNMFRENLPLVNVEVKYKVKPSVVLKTPVVVRNENNGGEFIFYLPGEDSCYDVSVLSYSLSRVENGAAKIISTQDVHKERRVDCSEDMRYHNWNSEQAWNIYNSGTKKIIGKENREQKAQETKERNQERTEELKNKVDNAFDDMVFRTRGNNMSVKLFDFTFTIVPDNATILDETYFGGGFGRFKTMIPINDFVCAGGVLSAGKLYEKTFVDLMAEINAHIYLTEKLALSAWTGVGLMNVVFPEFELGASVSYSGPKDTTLHLDFGGLWSSATLSGKGAPVLSLGVSFPIPDAVTDFVTDIVNRVF